MEPLSKNEALLALKHLYKKKLAKHSNTARGKLSNFDSGYVSGIVDCIDLLERILSSRPLPLAAVLYWGVNGIWEYYVVNPTAEELELLYRVNGHNGIIGSESDDMLTLAEMLTDSVDGCRDHSASHNCKWAKKKVIREELRTIFADISITCSVVS